MYVKTNNFSAIFGYHNSNTRNQKIEFQSRTSSTNEKLSIGSLDYWNQACGHWEK